MFTLASAFGLFTLALVVVSNKANECETLLRSVRIEVPALIVHTLCQDTGNASLVISCQQSVWRETIHGFCNSYDLNIGEATMRHILMSETVTLYLMRLDHTLDAARVVILIPDAVQQYRISVWGHQNTRFVLTVDTTCLKSKQEMQKEELGANDAKPSPLYPFPNGTISKLTSNSDQYLPEYSRPNNLPLELKDPDNGLITNTELNDSNIGQFSSTMATPKRVRGGIKHNSFRPSFPTTETSETIFSPIFLKSSTLVPRSSSLDYIASSSHPVGSDNSKVLFKELNNGTDKPLEASPELDKLEWMENRKAQFEKKMDYYQNVYPSNENISDYGDYSTEIVNQKIDKLNKNSRTAEPSNILLQAYSNKTEILENNLQEVTTKTLQNVSHVKLLYRVLNNELSNSSADITSVKDTFTNSMGDVTTTNILSEQIDTIDGLPLFLSNFNEAVSNVIETVSTDTDFTHSATPWPALLSSSMTETISTQPNAATLSVANTFQDDTTSKLFVFPASMESSMPVGTHSTTSGSITSDYTTSNNVPTQQKETSTTNETPTLSSTASHPSITIITNVALTSTTSDPSTASTTIHPVVQTNPTTTLFSTVTTSITSSSSTATPDSSSSVSSSKLQTSSPTIASSSTTPYIASPSTNYTVSSSTTFVPAASSSTHAASSTTSYPASSTISYAASSTNTDAAPSKTPNTASSTTQNTTLSTVTPRDQTTTHSSSKAPSTIPKEPTSPPATPNSESASNPLPSAATSTDSTARLPFTIPYPVDTPGQGQQSSTASNQAGATEESGKDDDTVWPVIIALVLGIPALVVIGIAVTVIHRRSRPSREKVFAMKALRSHNSTPKLSATSATIRQTLRLSTTSMEV